MQDSKKWSRRIKSLVIVFLVAGLMFFNLAGIDKTWINFLETMGISIAYTIAYGFGNIFLNDVLDHRYSWTDQTKMRVFTAVIGTLILNIVITYGLNYLNFVVLQGLPLKDFFTERINFINWLMINFALLVATFLHAWHFMRALKQQSKKEVTQQKFIASAASTQFETLKNQLDPHFLFNSLNVLSSLVEENPVQAQDFIEVLAKLYRYILEQKDKPVVPLQEELEFSENYMELLKYRFGKSLIFNCTVQNTKDQYIAPLSLQLLLENCIKHNQATEVKPLEIKVFERDGDLVVENNLQPKTTAKKSYGVGLSNIGQRYRLLSSRKIKVEQTADRFTVSLPIFNERIKIMETTKEDQRRAYDSAVRHVNQLKGFYGHLISYVAVNTLLIVINLVTEPHQIWFIYPLLGWGAGLAIHAISLFALGKGWEERKIREILKRERRF